MGYSDSTDVLICGAGADGKPIRENVVNPEAL